MTPTKTTDLFLLEELDDAGRAGELAESDLDALHAIADWIESYVVQPHKELGHAGPVCPFVPGALERRTLWLTPEQIADRDLPAVVELMDGYRRLFLDTPPTDGDDGRKLVDDEDIFPLWARRFGESAVHALADELRCLPWNEGDSHEHER